MGKVSVIKKGRASRASNSALSTEEKAAVRCITAIAREFEQVAKRSEVNVAHYRLMLFLRNGPRRAGEIAATVLVNKVTISMQIATARENGWVAGETDSIDKRATNLILTAKGRAVMDKFESELISCLEGLVRPVDRAKTIHHLSELWLAMAATRETRYADLGNQP